IVDVHQLVAEVEASLTLDVVRHHPAGRCFVRPEPDKRNSGLALRFQDEPHRALHQRVDGPVDRPPGKRDLVPAAEASLLQALSYSDSHERPKQIVKTLGCSTGGGLLQRGIAILPISFLPQVRRHFREIEWEAEPSSGDGHAVKDILQEIRGMRRWPPTNEAPESDSVSKLEITVSRRELRLCPNRGHAGGTTIVIEECAIAHDIQRRARQAR